VALIDARIQEIEKSKQDLLQAVASPDVGIRTRLSGLELKPTPRCSTGGFKIRY
jgi:hypothetical protein